LAGRALHPFLVPFYALKRSLRVPAVEFCPPFLTRRFFVHPQMSLLSLIWVGLSHFPYTICLFFFRFFSLYPVFPLWSFAKTFVFHLRLIPCVERPIFQPPFFLFFSVWLFFPKPRECMWSRRVRFAASGTRLYLFHNSTRGTPHPPPPHTGCGGAIAGFFHRRLLFVLFHRCRVTWSGWLSVPLEACWFLPCFFDPNFFCFSPVLQLVIGRFFP